MAPPHPASGNGDVIERALEKYAPDIDVHGPICVRIVKSLASAGILKLSEGSDSGQVVEVEQEGGGHIMQMDRSPLSRSKGSGDGKMRDMKPLIKAVGYVQASRTASGYHDPALKNLALKFMDLWPDIWILLNEALATPAPSPIDAAEMRAFGASEAACVHWPEDTELHRACREAYCRGAADALPTPAREIDRENIAQTICRSGKFETGEGTCAFACMDQLGDCRKAGCKHATAVHGKLADAILSLIGGRP